MNRYKQLTLEERYIIYSLKKEGFSQSAIAKNLRRDRTTIWREVKRNSGCKNYRPKQAHEKAIVRRKSSHKHIKFTGRLKELVEGYLCQEWSPEQICNHITLEHDLTISTERIYQHIWSDKANGGTLYKHLRQNRKKRRKRYGSGKNNRGHIKNRTCIEDRPSIVDKRSRVGDWEIDTLIGKNHQGALLSMVERKSRLTLLVNVGSKDASKVTQATITSLKPIEEYVKTITCDNGKEFGGHEEISNALGTGVYFAHPYCSWERGSNENTNGLIRQYVPKKSDFSLLKESAINFIINRLNTRPRKCLGYRKPIEVFLGEVGSSYPYKDRMKNKESKNINKKITVALTN